MLYIFRKLRLSFIFLIASHCIHQKTNKILSLLSDFGIVDTAAASMKGVALSINHFIQLFDLIHQI